MKTLKPMIEIDTAMLDHVKSLRRDAALEHMLLHCRTIHMASSTMGMSNDHDILDAKLINSNKQTTHDAAERMEYNAARILDELSIAISEAKRGREQLCKPRIHTRQHGELFIRIFARYIPLVTITGHELPIIF